MGKEFTIRRAGPHDGDAIAAAHIDSIRSIGPHYYDDNVVQNWCAGLEGSLYAGAMTRGEVFFIAVATANPSEVLGFSTHRVDEGVHGTAVYVRGTAVRQGIGSALFSAAETAARTAGATTIQIDASLPAVDFYKAHGFEELDRGAHVLPSGASMSCVFMRKHLRQVGR